MSGANSQTILLVHLTALGDPREQLRRRTTDLPAGTKVVVSARNIKPVSFGVPFINAADFAWYRTDLFWQFEDDEPEVVRAWGELLQNLEEAHS